MSPDLHCSDQQVYIGNTIMSKTLSIEQAANRLSCSGQTIRRLIATGTLKSFLFGKRRLIEERELKNYIDRLRGIER